MDQQQKLGPQLAAPSTAPVLTAPPSQQLNLPPSPAPCAALVSALAALPGAAQPAPVAHAGAASDGAQYLREVLKIPLAPKPSATYSWQLPADTYLTVLRSRDEGDAQATASAPAVPANVAEAREWIAAWRSKQARA